MVFAAFFFIFTPLIALEPPTDHQTKDLTAFWEAFLFRNYFLDFSFNPRQSSNYLFLPWPQENSDKKNKLVIKDVVMADLAGNSFKDLGFPYFVMPYLQNQEFIRGTLEKVIIAKKENFNIDVFGNRLLSFRVEKRLKDKLVAKKSLIDLQDGTMILKASGLQEIIDYQFNENVSRLRKKYAQDANKGRSVKFYLFNLNNIISKTLENFIRKENGCLSLWDKFFRGASPDLGSQSHENKIDHPNLEGILNFVEKLLTISEHKIQIHAEGLKEPDFQVVNIATNFKILEQAVALERKSFTSQDPLSNTKWNVNPLEDLDQSPFLHKTGATEAHLFYCPYSVEESLPLRDALILANNTDLEDSQDYFKQASAEQEHREAQIFHDISKPNKAFNLSSSPAPLTLAWVSSIKEGLMCELEEPGLIEERIDGKHHVSQETVILDQTDTNFYAIETSNFCCPAETLAKMELFPVPKVSSMSLLNEKPDMTYQESFNRYQASFALLSPEEYPIADFNEEILPKTKTEPRVPASMADFYPAPSLNQMCLLDEPPFEFTQISQVREPKQDLILSAVNSADVENLKTEKSLFRESLPCLSLEMAYDSRPRPLGGKSKKTRKFNQLVGFMN